jgi:hypothetical protein
MLAIALGVYFLLFAVVVAVFYAASKAKPSSSTLDWDDDPPAQPEPEFRRARQEHDVLN